MIVIVEFKEETLKVPATSFSLGGNQPIRGHTGIGVRRPEIKDFYIHRIPDNYSIKLVYFSSIGKLLSEVYVNYKYGSGNQQKTINWYFTNVLISDIQTSASANTESIGFSFDTYKVEY